MNLSAKLREKAISRREWIPRFVRAVFLGGMALFGVAQIFKARRLANDPDCIRLYTCRDCIEFSRCNLDKAETFRKTQRRL